MKKILFVLACGICLQLIATLADAASVGGYVRRDGTYVQPYQRTNPDSNPWNNYSTKGNTNPFTGNLVP